MDNAPEPVNGIHKLVLDAANMLTYIVLGVILVFFVAGTYHGYSLQGVIVWTMILLFFLFVAFLAGYCLSQLFPDRRSVQFSFLFNVIEIVLILIITLAGIELAEKTVQAEGILDTWHISEMAEKYLRGSLALREAGVLQVLLENPGLLPVIKLSSVVFSLFGSDTAVLSCLLMVVHLLCALFAYRLTRTVSGRVASIAVYGLMMLIPSQVCTPAVNNSYVYSAMFIMCDLLLFNYSRRMSRMEKDARFRLIPLAFSVLPLGAAAAMTPAALILPFAQSLYLCVYQRNRGGANPDDKGMRLYSSLIIIAGSLIVFLLLSFSGSMQLGVSLPQYFAGYFSAFKPGGSIAVNLPMVWGTDSYADAVMMDRSPFANQMAYGCVIGSAFICVILCWMKGESDYFAARAYLLFTVLITLLSGSNTMEHYGAFCVLCVLTGGLFGQVYNSLRIRRYRELYPAAAQDEKEESTAAHDIVAAPSPAESDAAATEPVPGPGPEENAGIITIDDLPEESPGIITIDDLPETVDEAAPGDTSAIPEDIPDTGLVTIDDVLGESPDESTADISDGSDGSMIENVAAIPDRGKDTEADFDFDIAEGDDFDY